MADVLVDTDVFVDHLRGAHELKPGRHRLHYSVITRVELLAGNSATNLAHWNPPEHTQPTSCWPRSVRSLSTALSLSEPAESDGEPKSACPMR